MQTDKPIVVKINVDSTQLDGGIAKVNADLKTLSSTASSTAGGLGLQSKSATEAAAATHSLSLETTAAKRELVVLAHELSQGNFKKFGGSLLVLAEQTGAAGLLLNPVTLSIVAIGAAVAAFAVQAYEGAKQSAELANALRVTGGYAGVTEGQFNSLVSSVSASSGATLAASRDIAQAIVSTGQFGPRVLADATDAAARYAKGTGQTAEQVAKDFATMGDGVAKYALEHDRQFNFLTTTQYSYIKSLEDQGRTEEAELVVLRALSDHFGGPLVQNLGTLEQTLHSVKGAWDAFWEAAKASGRTKTIDDQIAELDDKLNRFKTQARSAAQPGEGFRVPTDTVPLTTSNAAAMEAQRSTLITQRAQDQLRAFDAASNARIQKIGVEARARLDALDEESKGVSRLQQALDALHRDQAADAAAGTPRSAAQIAAEEQTVRRKYTDTKSLADTKALAEAQLALKKSYAALGEQVAQQSIAAEQHANDVLYQTGKVNLVEYYNTKAKLERESLDNQEQMLLAEYAATVAEAQGLSKSADKVKNQAKQLDLVTKIAAVEGKKALVTGGEDAAAPIAYRLGRELRDSSAQVNASLIKDDQARAQAQLDIEIGLQREKIDQQLQGSAKYKDIIDQFDAYTVLRQRKLTEDLKPEWQKMLEGYQDTVQYMRKAQDDFLKGFIDGGRDAFTTFVTTGKLSVGNLVTFIEQQFAKMVYDKYLAQYASDLGSTIFSGIAGLFGGGISVDTGGVGTNFTGGQLPTAGGRAAGGPVDAGATYLVGEQGPELLRMGKQSGTIVPNKALTQDSSINLTIAPTFNGGVTRNDLVNGMNYSIAVAVSKVAELRRRGSPAFSAR